MKVIIDECVHSPLFQAKLIQALPDHEVIYLGDGLPDIDIERYMITNKDAVLITADVEFDTHFDFKRSLFIESNESIKDRITLIKAWLK